MKRKRLQLPRLLRLRDAPDYCGTDRNRFNSEVRPLMTRCASDSRAMAFDRLELDAWVDQNNPMNGYRIDKKTGGYRQAALPYY